MKKRIFITILLVAVAAFVAVRGFTADNASSLRLVGDSHAVCDGSTGYCQEVDSNGAAWVSGGKKSIALVEGASLNAGYQIVSGACYVDSISFTSALDDAYVEVYDYTNATAAYKKDDIANAVGKGSLPRKYDGAYFSNGVFVDASDATSAVSIVYRQ